MDKIDVKQAMMKLTQEQMTQATEKYQDFLVTAKLNRTESIDIDQHAQAVTAAELAEAFDDQIQDYTNKVERLKEIDFGPKTTVCPGAIIDMGDRFLVIAVSTAEFDCDGKPFIGISPSAPVYAAIRDRKTGEDCEFNGKELHIGNIY